jgi:hypothetical protein
MVGSTGIGMTKEITTESMKMMAGMAQNEILKITENVHRGDDVRQAARRTTMAAISERKAGALKEIEAAMTERGNPDTDGEMISKTPLTITEKEVETTVKTVGTGDIVPTIGKELLNIQGDTIVLVIATMKRDEEKEKTRAAEIALGIVIEMVPGIDRIIRERDTEMKRSRNDAGTKEMTENDPHAAKVPVD